MKQNHLNILIFMLVICALAASLTSVMQYRNAAVIDDEAIWFDQYGAIIQKASQSVVALDTRSQEKQTKEGIIYQQNFGSGFCISTDGLIITNEHVVHGAEQIRVILADKRQYFARLVASDTRADIALLKIDVDDLKPLPFGDMNQLHTGQLTIVLGNPLGTGNDGTAVATFGRINRLHASLSINRGNHHYYNNLIQTSAPTKPGNSGGPLINTMGQAIGIVTAMASLYPTGKEFGFAIALDKQTRTIIETLKQSQTPVYPFLGVYTTLMEPEEQLALGVDDANGALVREVVPFSAAYKAGIRPGDLIRAVNSREVYSPADLLRIINGLHPNEQISVTVFRGNNGFHRKLVLTARLLARPK